MKPVAKDSESDFQVTASFHNIVSGILILLFVVPLSSAEQTNEKTVVQNKKVNTEQPRASRGDLDTEAEGACVNTLCQTKQNMPIAENVCKAVTSSPLCEDVLESDLRQCDINPYNPVNIAISHWNNFKGCGQGVGKAIMGLLGLAWWVMKMPFSPQARERWQTDVNNFKEGVDRFNRFYFEREKQKVLPRYEGVPLAEQKAGLDVVEKLWGEKVWPVLSEVIAQESLQFNHCMNEGARTRVICGFLSEYIVPPVGLFAIIRRGRAGLTVAQRARIKDLVEGKKGRKGVSEEALLKQQGYRPIFTEGLDEMKRQLKVGERLRKEFHAGRFDPKKTHVPEFADKVEDTLKFIEDGIREQGFDDTVERLKILNDFKKEAGKRLKDNQITYNWWTKFNARLSILASAQQKPVRYPAWYKDEKEILREFEFARYFYDIDNSFPADIYIPTTQKLGIMAINRASSGNIVPIGMTNKVETTDGIPMKPKNFFQHDFSHHLNDSYGSTNKRFQNYFETNAQKLNQSDREKVEIMHFMLEHEGLRRYSYGAKPIMEIKEDIRESILGLGLRIGAFQKAKNLGGLLPESVDLSSGQQVRAYLGSAIDTYFHMMKDFK